MQRRPVPRTTYYCSFCGKSQDQVERLIAGPNGVYVCNECVATFSKADQTPQKERGLRCSFCGKNQRQVEQMTGGPRGVTICSECIELCEEIIAEEMQNRAQQRATKEKPEE